MEGIGKKGKLANLFVSRFLEVRDHSIELVTHGFSSYTSLCKKNKNIIVSSVSPDLHS